MREIKFEICVGKLTGEVLYTDIHSLDRLINRNGTLLNANEKIIWKRQFTGLKDKNGKDIYSGDIVKDGSHIMVVGWNEKCASFSLKQSGWLHDHFFQEASDSEECEVIGNIHENPTLMEDK